MSQQRAADTRDAIYAVDTFPPPHMAFQGSTSTSSTHTRLVHQFHQFISLPQHQTQSSDLFHRHTFSIREVKVTDRNSQKYPVYRHLNQQHVNSFRKYAHHTKAMEKMKETHVDYNGLHRSISDCYKYVSGYRKSVQDDEINNERCALTLIKGFSSTQALQLK